jgi:putative transposase
LIQQAWADSGKVYSNRKLHDELRDPGETCSENRTISLANLAYVLAQIGCMRRPNRYVGKPEVVASKRLDRQFEFGAPD